MRVVYALSAVLICSGCDRTSKPDQIPPPAQTQNANTAGPNQTVAPPAVETGPIEIVPLQHASMILRWNDLTIAVDPVRGALEAAGGETPRADLIVVTDIHGDHFDVDAVASLRSEDGQVVVPKAVAERAGAALPDPVIVANGATKAVLGGRVQVTGVAMYNLQRKREDSGEPYHVKGRGNGYVVTLGDQRVYISGDTECIPEMKELRGIDLAFVCMNLPYTMTPEEAAGCIAAFEPKKLVPYHHRGQDPRKLDELLADAPIEIEYLDWYPATDNPLGE